MKSKVTVDNWASLLTEELQKSGDQHPGPEWKTIYDLMNDHPQIKLGKMYRLIASLKEQGKAEEKEVFLMRANSSRRVRQIFYRIKN
jgi:hypothetical protein